MFLEKIRQKFDLSVVKCIEFGDMSIDLTVPNHWSASLSSDSMIARLAHIPGFTWPIQQVQLRIVVQDKGVDLGSFESPYTAATVNRGIVNSFIPHTTLNVFDQSRTPFTAFVGALATQAQHTFVVKGSADIIFSLGVLGTHSIKGVDFVSDLTLKGLNNLPEIKCTVIKDVVFHKQMGIGESRRYLEVAILLDIHNQSQLMLTLGDVTLSTSYNGPNSVSAAKGGQGKDQIGTIIIRNLTLLQGMNDSRTATLRLDTTLDSTKQFLANVALEPQTLYLRGFHGTSKNVALTAGLATLSSSFVIPRFQAPSLT
ncbi:hypothetical protein B0O80DRAFT_496474 [Mortierella sp. GBAus27b]|nr:hypothetical protein BGX31_006462 [Mortierella sp. GBA43]KAI8357727.1 hypothetical protein B0O80DRAFT_496474 [Mortierella sp. GBAus27b]